MSNFSALIATIQANITTNGNEEITGAVLQDVLEAMVQALGTEAINNLETALSNEVGNRQNADGTLQNNIDAEALRAGIAEGALQTAIDGIKSNIDNGFVYAGIATPSGTPASGKVFYLAVTAGTYTNYGELVVTQGINILKNNGTAWSQEQLIALDNTPTPSSSGLVKSGGVFEEIMTNGSAFDLTVHNSGTTYADLSAALTAMDSLPAAYKKGGMSIKFVQTSDNNKYVQYRLTAQSFTTDVTQWEDLNGVEKEITEIKIKIDGNIKTTFVYGQISQSTGQVVELSYRATSGHISMPCKIKLKSDYAFSLICFYKNGSYSYIEPQEGLNEYYANKTNYDTVRFSIKNINSPSSGTISLDFDTLVDELVDMNNLTSRITANEEKVTECEQFDKQSMKVPNMVAMYNGELIPSLNISGNCLQVGGGRFALEGFNIYAIGVGGRHRIRIFGTANIPNSNVALWGLYNGTPDTTPAGTPDTTNYVDGSAASPETGKTSYFNEVIETEGASYLLLSIGTESTIKVYSEDEQMESLYSKASWFELEGWINASGQYYHVAGSAFKTTGYIKINEFTKGSLLHALVSQSRSGMYGLAFYDSSKSLIGTPYRPSWDDGTTTSVGLYDIVLDDDLLSQYPNAVWFRCCNYSNPSAFRNSPGKIVLGSFNGLYELVNDSAKWKDKTYLLNLCKKIICIGDSVTRGYAVENGEYVDLESAQTNPVVHGAYSNDNAFSYPAQLQRLIPHCSVTNAGMSGNEAYEFYVGVREGNPFNGYSYYDFSEYDIVIIEFGWNHSRFGALSPDSINTPNTNSWAMSQMVSGIISQNPSAKIFLNISSHITDVTEFFQAMKTLYPSINIINLNNSKYLWLDNPDYHGSVGGDVDMVHFNKKGYNAKAFFIRNVLLDLL